MSNCGISVEYNCILIFRKCISFITALKISVFHCICWPQIFV